LGFLSQSPRVTIASDTTIGSFEGRHLLGSHNTNETWAQPHKRLTPLST